jgi:hypothetical protein
MNTIYEAASNFFFETDAEILEEAKKKEGKCKPGTCIKKVGDKWRVVSNKTGKLWPAHYKTKEDAHKALEAYHANKK